MSILLKNRKEAERHRYGTWAGNPEGRAYDPKCCAAEVWGEHQYHQCRHKPGHGPDAIFCKSHDPDEISRKQTARETAEADRRDQAKRNFQRTKAGQDALKLLLAFDPTAAEYDARGATMDAWNRQRLDILAAANL